MLQSNEPEHHQRYATASVPSAAARWLPLARWVAREQAIGRWAAAKGSVWHFAYEFVRFGCKQAWACLFAGLMLVLLLVTFVWYPKGAMLARYDFLTLAALAIQLLMLRFKLETFEEARVIAVFHVVGTVMEIFKTNVGSWAYPEASILRLAGVPLFTGFMYACVGSFMVRAWHLFDFRFTRHPPLWALSILSVAIYANFFAHHYLADLRPLLFVAAAALLGPCIIHYKIWKVHRRMPMLIAALLTAGCIWLAENVGTFAAAWVYPHQKSGWHLVSFGKFGSWFLLMIISYTLVAALHRRPQK